MKYSMEHRSQRSKRGRFGFHGPDHYTAVVGVPDDQEFPSVLNAQRILKRGGRVIYCGEWYGQHRGPRSAYQDAVNYARMTIARLEHEDS